MTKETADFLVMVSEHCGNQEVQLRENYSGRGMYGRETFAIVVNSQTQLLADVIQFILDNVHGDEEVGEMIWDGGDIPDVSTFSIDNMGRGVVIY